MRHAFGVILLLLAGSAQATPVQLTESQFASAISGLPAIIEDFEGFESINFVNPFLFANGRASNDETGGFVQIGTTFCGEAGDHCLITNWPTLITTLDLFPQGTTYFGVELNLINPTHTIEIIVTGGSGVATFQALDPEFLGFSDSLGITSITFQSPGLNGGTANYSFDNITTAAVPIPAAVWLFGSGLGLLGWFRRKQSA